MRYLENGVQDKVGTYFFDNQRFDVLSYFIYFDCTMQQVDLVGLMDQTDVDFVYPTQDFSSDFYTNIYPLSTTMFTYLESFENISDFTLDATHIQTNENLKFNVMNFIDNINYQNQMVTKHCYYDHGISNIFPFAELIIIKIHNTDTIISAMLNKFVSKTSDSTSISYNLSNESQMSKYLINYSTVDSDFTSIYLKMIYNQADTETVNRENLIVSSFLYPTILSDSSKLYFDLGIESTSADLTDKYTFFDLSENDLIYLNNKHLCRVKSKTDITNGGTPLDYTFNSNQLIEFLEIDNTTDLSVYMGGETVQYDFTKITYQYKFNIRSIKRLFSNNILYSDNSNWFKMLFTFKTFFGYQNRSSDSSANDQKNYFTSPLNMSQIIYSGTYDATNNNQINLLSLLNTFYADQYTLPYDVTILKSSIGDGTPFYIDLFISNSTDISSFFGNYVRNGIYIFNEGNTTETMILRLNDYTTINANTFRLSLTSIMYDSAWYAGLSSVYHIPSNSQLIQQKYHIYNVMPYIRLDQFTHSNDLNNLITMHLFGYVQAGPNSMTWNGNEIPL